MKPRFSHDFTLRYYLNAPVLWRLAIKHLLILGVICTVIAVWYMFIRPPLVVSYPEQAIRGDRFVWWGAIVLLIGLSFSSRNGKRLLIWLGFLTPKVRKAEVAADSQPLMRWITRFGCYLLFSGEVAFMVWWYTVFKIYPQFEKQLVYLNVLPYMWVTTFLATIHFDKIWWVRRTRVTLVLAVVGLLTAIAVYYNWAVVTLDYWWAP